MRLKTTLAAFGTAAMFVLAACGDDEAPATTTPIDTGATGATGLAGPVTPEELIDEGDDVCAEAYTALASLPPNAPGSQQGGIVDGLLESLESLGDPGPENRDDLDAFYDSLDEAADAFNKDRTSEAETALSEARAAASDYGFDECGKRGDSIISQPSVPGADSGVESGGVGDDTSEPAAPEPIEPVTPEPAPEPVAPDSDAGGTGTEPPADSGGDDTGGTSGGVSP